MDNMEIKNNESVIKSNEITLVDIFRLILSRWKWILSTGVIVAVLVYLGVTFLVTPKYQSKVTMYVYNEKETVNFDAVQSDDLQAAQNLAETYTHILQSNTVLDTVLKELDDEEITRKSLKEIVEVGRVQNTQILQVTVTATDRDEAMLIANAFAKVGPSEIVRLTKVGGVEVIDYAECAKEPSSPKTLVITLIAAIVSVLLISVFFVIKSLSDITIYIPEDIEDISNVTILGNVPTLDGSVNNDKSWTVNKGGYILYERKKED